MSAAQVAYVYYNLEETLEEEKRSDTVSLSACNPFSFLRFFAGGAKIVK